MPEFTSTLGNEPGNSSLLHRMETIYEEVVRLSEILPRTHPTEERPILIGSLLENAGYLLRRPQALASVKKNSTVVDKILFTLSEEDLRSWFENASLTGLKATLKQAVENAFEAGLSEQKEERERFVNLAMEGLAKRERFAGVLRSLARWEQQHGPLASDLHHRHQVLQAEINKVDTALRSSTLSLEFVDEERRAERDLLEESLREGAWWYSATSENNDFSAMVLGASPTTLARSSRVIEVLQTTKTPPQRHISSEELWSFDLGLLNEEQRAWMHRHSLSCKECRQALMMLSEGEEAIEEALHLPEESLRKHRKQGEVFDHPLFRVQLLFSGKKHRLWLEEKREGVLSQASLTNGSPLRRIASGYELQLSSRPQRSQRLRVTLTTGEEILIPLG